MTDSGTTDTGATLARTPLHELHLELGARMVPFAGYEMPVQYPMGVLREHLHTREQAGLFDVSHMGQIRLAGDDRVAALESLVGADVAGLQPGHQRYALFTNEQGGILDDLMVVNTGDDLFLVVNAACKAQDLAHLRARIGGRCQVEPLEDRALLALQGPAAAGVMAALAPDAAGLTFMQARYVAVDGIECHVSRSGYTGEDGFEISVPADRAEQLARRLLEADPVAPIGLGARDSLRLEAGMCLYGHDMDTATTPVEASLLWAIGKARRAGGERAGGFPGADIVFRQIEQGTARRRVGIRGEGRAPIREGAELVDAEGHEVGRITSGGFGPSCGGPVAMGYVDSALTSPGTTLAARVRGKDLPVAVARMPFVPNRYYRG